MIDARNQRLGLYVKQKKWVVEHLDDVVSTIADAMSIGNDTMRLAAKFFMKGRVAWGENLEKLPPILDKLSTDYNSTVQKFMQWMNNMEGKDENQTPKRFLEVGDQGAQGGQSIDLGDLNLQWPAKIPTNSGAVPDSWL